MVFGGLISQAAGIATSVIGGGPVGQAEARADVAADRVVAYADACVRTAISNPGLTGDSIAVQSQIGVVPPAGATCKIDANAGGSRIVYAWAPIVPGAVGRVIEETDASEAWYMTSTANGVATGIVGGAPHAIPSTVPFWSLLYQAEVKP
ncbi:hypothetical protein WS58_16605 [Burkholderia pseudomultivorans]|nr:hypothetical protein WS57_35070 [Burkholderia pseudomultivorans]KVC27784.1 hypothetical protein WS55_12975 [Burkholderia pseudomultivorans]KVC36906.1 hypothetical protein WS56_00345 [Burkholderia pseudomultivorans]KVC42147.1 hypothetical protein WS58_16605 [Burkholderia pseudomultivorans]